MLGTKGESEQPYGTSDASGVTGVDPQDPIDPESPGGRISDHED